MGPDKAHTHRLAIRNVVGIEGPDAVLEAALHRRIERAVRITAIDPPDRPLSGFGVIGAQGYAMGGSSGLDERGLFHICRTIDQRAIAARSAKLDPRVLAGSFHAMPNLPFSALGIKVARAVALQ